MGEISKLKLKRLNFGESKTETLGILYCGDFRFFTLELPWLDNAQNISCITPGKYKWFKRFSPGKKYEVIELIDVTGRSFIQIHLGNYTDQILGCILPGMGLKDIDDDGVFDVTNSEKAFNKIMSMTSDSGEIEIL